MQWRLFPLLPNRLTNLMHNLSASCLALNKCLSTLLLFQVNQMNMKVPVSFYVGQFFITLNVQFLTCVVTCCNILRMFRFNFYFDFIK